jgi:hypothetical protein
VERIIECDSYIINFFLFSLFAKFGSEYEAREKEKERERERKVARVEMERERERSVKK